MTHTTHRAIDRNPIELLADADWPHCKTQRRQTALSLSLALFSLNSVFGRIAKRNGLNTHCTNFYMHLENLVCEQPAKSACALYVSLKRVQVLNFVLFFLFGLKPVSKRELSFFFKWKCVVRFEISFNLDLFLCDSDKNLVHQLGSRKKIEFNERQKRRKREKKTRKKLSIIGSHTM